MCFLNIPSKHYILLLFSIFSIETYLSLTLFQALREEKGKMLSSPVRPDQHVLGEHRHVGTPLDYSNLSTFPLRLSISPACAKNLINAC